MPPKSSNDKSAYKSKIKLDLEKLKNGETQAAKADLTKTSTRKLAKKKGVLSEGVKNVCVPTERKELLCSN